jgi:hypothetical protein
MNQFSPEAFGRAAILMSLCALTSFGGSAFADQTDAPAIVTQGQQNPAPSVSSETKGQSANSALAIPASQPGDNDTTLILPRLWAPNSSQPLPPAPPPLAETETPPSFLGCWQGRPNGYDRVYDIQSSLHIGEPGVVTVCFRVSRVDMEAEIAVPAALRAVELIGTMGLGHTAFHAHGLQTDIFSATMDAMRGRTTLQVQRKFEFLHVIPIPISPQPTVVDWRATLPDPDTLRVQAYQVVWLDGGPSFGATWHADFSRLADDPPTDR